MTARAESGEDLFMLERDSNTCWDCIRNGSGPLWRTLTWRLQIHPVGEFNYTMYKTDYMTVVQHCVLLTTIAIADVAVRIVQDCLTGQGSLTWRNDGIWGGDSIFQTIGFYIGDYS